MKVSEIDLDYLTWYLKLDELEDGTRRELEAMKQASLALVTQYTGLTEQELEEHEDITIAILVLLADMYDNRNLYLDYKNTKLNETVKTILGLHTTNLL